MQKCEKSIYQNKIQTILMPSNKQQTSMTASANNRCIYQEHIL